MSGSISIDVPITGSTTGSILFAGATGGLSQDNASLFYDATNYRLGLGVAAPATTVDIASATTTAGLAMRAGSTTAVSAASTGRIRYNESTHKFQVSENGGAYQDIQSGDEYALDIGEAIGSSTVGSLLFVGTGGVLQQDNAKLFWDNAGDKLGIGTASPGTTLDIASATTTAGLALAAGSTTAVSAANTGRVRYNEASGQKFQVSGNGGAYFDVATLAAPVTAGSVMFANASNQIAQNNAGLFWDNEAGKLGIGTATPAAALDIAGLEASIKMDAGPNASESVAGAGCIRYNNSIESFESSVNGQPYLRLLTGLVENQTLVSAPMGAVLFAGATTLAAYSSFVWDNGKLGVGSSVPDTTLDIASNSTDAGLGMAAGSTTAVSTASKGRIRYNESTNKFQVSANGAAYVNLAVGTGMAIGDAVAGATAGSILFGGAAGVLAQDNAKLFWDDAGDKLGIGTATPATTVDIKSATTTAGLGLGAGSTTAVSAANTSRVRHDEGTQKIQVSMNGAAYFDIVMQASALTTGRIAFANASGQVADSANLFWDNSANLLDIGGAVNTSVSFKHSGVKVLGAQGAAVGDATGGMVIDFEARAALNALLARLRASTGHGLIA